MKFRNIRRNNCFILKPLNNQSLFRLLRIFVLTASLSIFSQISLAQSFIAVGNYFGNGVNNREIIDVGFTPDMVIVKGNTNTDAVIRTNTMSGTLSKSVTVNMAANNWGITELTTSGFRVTNNVKVNENGIDYYWIAVQNTSDKIITGSYTGNNIDNRNLTGIGFSPDYLMLFPESANNASMKFPVPASDYTLPFHGNNSGIANAIQSLHSDGFQVGNDVSVNADNVIYHYVAFKADNTNIIIGDYPGDGSDNRWIPTAITPTYLLIRSNSNTFPYQKLATLCGDAAFNFHNQDAYVNTIQSFGLDGFEIGNNNSVNHQNRHYYYFALKGSITGEDCFSLPIELISFEGKSLKNHIQLDWSTASEVNNDYFEILRSSDGATWFPAGMMDGKGNSQQISYYSWIDVSPMPRNNYYKLRQVDYSGEYSYTDVILVTFSHTNPDLKVYPNPAINFLIVENLINPIRIRLLNSMGITLIDQLLTDSHQQLDISGIPSGVYIVTYHNEFTNGNLTILKK
jgi:predicted Zn-dependent protease with MMP-like domain